MIRKLREQSRPGGLTLSQTAVIGRLDRNGPATITALARADGMRPQSMGAIVAALEAAGMVTGAPDPADGRQTIVSITDACRAALHASRAQRDDWLAQALAEELDGAEQAQLAAALALLRRLIDRP